jgi:hypothetical protein
MPKKQLLNTYCIPRIQVKSTTDRLGREGEEAQGKRVPTRGLGLITEEVREGSLEEVALEPSPEGRVLAGQDRILLTSSFPITEPALSEWMSEQAPTNLQNEWMND